MKAIRLECFIAIIIMMYQKLLTSRPTRLSLFLKVHRLRLQNVVVQTFSHKQDLMLYIDYILLTSGYATWFTAGGAIRIAHYDVIDDVITRKL